MLQIRVCEQDSTWILELETKTEWGLPPRTQQSDEDTRRLGWDPKKKFSGWFRLVRDLEQRLDGDGNQSGSHYLQLEEDKQDYC